MVARGEMGRFWSLESLHPVSSDGGAEPSALVDDNGSEEDFSYEDLCRANPRYLQPGGEQLAINELIGDGSVVCAEALWDHVTMDEQELGFKAGDVIQVLEASHKDWWWGRSADREAWFPASFVRLRVNQEELSEGSSGGPGEEQEEDTGRARHKHPESKQQMRANVVQEIMDTERVYIKHLRDICEVGLDDAVARSLSRAPPLPRGPSPYPRPRPRPAPRPLPLLAAPPLTQGPSLPTLSPLWCFQSPARPHGCWLTSC